MGEQDISPELREQLCQQYGKSLGEVLEALPVHEHDTKRSWLASREHIEAAAIRVNGEVWTLPRPARHHILLRAWADAHWKDGAPTRPPNDHVQGFTTNSGRFVDRGEGERIARAAPRRRAHERGPLVTVLDERGDPVQVEYIGPGYYLASGWWGGVGRYSEGSTANHARWLWGKRRLLPKQRRRPVPGPLQSPTERRKHIVAKWGPELERLSQLRAILPRLERPGGRSEEEG